MRRKTKVYTYRESHHSRHGLAATGIAAVSALLFIVMIWITTRTGQATPLMGAIGICCLACSLYGTYLGLHSFRDVCRSFLFSKIGSLWCGLMTVIWFLIVCLGLAS
ncbi:MAG: DUF6142 family protein [Lachnospiraceae bacterium]|nr:DUF6142 family protein [Lachnospiraceae bacterium]